MTGISIIYSTWAYWYVKKYSHFKWVQMMIGLCFLSNFFTLFFIVVDRQERKAWHQAHPKLECVLMFCAIWTLYGFQNVIYWLFGFKYWVIALEIPTMIQEDNEEFDPNKPVERKKRFWTEKRYKIL